MALRSFLRVVSFALVFSVAQHAQAQPSFADIDLQFAPGIPLPNEESAEARLIGLDINVGVPVPLGERSFLLPGVSYHLDSVSFRNAPLLSKPPRLHSIEASLRLVQLLPRRWTLTLSAALGLAGDFQSVDSGLLRGNALVLANHKFNERVTLGGGFLATYGFGVFLPLPAIFLRWSPTRRFWLEAFLPAYVRMTVLAHERVETSLVVQVAGQNYAIREARSAPCPSFDDGSDACLDNIAYSLATAQLDVGVNLGVTIWLHLHGGVTLFRRFEQRTASGRTLPDGENRVANGPVIGVRLVVRLPSGEAEGEEGEGEEIEPTPPNPSSDP
ncbi:MAG: DUF6268 family outer membrane beta-barrel protein [Myxococcota bacterium]